MARLVQIGKRRRGIEFYGEFDRVLRLGNALQPTQDGDLEMTRLMMRPIVLEGAGNQFQRCHHLLVATSQARQFNVGSSLTDTILSRLGKGINGFGILPLHGPHQPQIVKWFAIIRIWVATGKAFDRSYSWYRSRCGQPAGG